MPRVEEWIRVYQTGSTRDIRRRAAIALARHDPLPPPEILISIFDEFGPDAEPWVAMVQSQNRQFVGPMVERLKSSSYHARERACMVLAELGNASVVPYLLPLLFDNAGSVQVDAIRALAKIGGQEAYDALLQLQATPPDGVAEQQEMRRALRTIERDMGHTPHE
jgi:HEAT repeats